MWEQGVRKDEAEIEKLKKVIFFFFGGVLYQIWGFSTQNFGGIWADGGENRRSSGT